MTIRYQLRRAASFTTLNLASKASLITFELLLALQMQPEEFGKVALGFAVVIVAVGLSSMGMHFGIVNLLSVYRAENKKVEQKSLELIAAVVPTIVAAFVGVSLFLGSDLVAKNLFSKANLAPILQWAALTIAIETANQSFAAILRGRGDYTKSVWAFDLCRNGGLLIVIALSSLTDDVPLAPTSVMGLHFIFSSLGTLLGIFFVVSGMSIGVLNRAHFSRVVCDFWQFSKPLATWNILQIASGRIFVLVAGVFLSTLEVGFVAIANRLISVLLFAQTMSNQLLAPEFAKSIKSGEFDRVKKLYEFVSLILVVFASFLATPLVVAPDTIFNLFDPKYVQFSFLLLPLLMAYLTDIVTGPAGQLLIDARRGDLVLKLSILNVGMQFGFVLPCLAFYGLSGGLLAEATRIVFFVAVRLYTLARVVPVKLIEKRWLSAAAISVSTLLGAALASKLLSAIPNAEVLLILLSWSLIFIVFVRGGLPKEILAYRNRS